MAVRDVDLDSKLEYDPSFKGPSKRRSCTDVCCLLVFVVFLASWAGVAYFAFRNGDPEKFTLPRDSDGKICGMNEMVEQPYLVFFDLTQCLNPAVFQNGCKTPQVCVSKCPNANWASVEVMPNPDWSKVRKELICRNTSIAESVNTKERFNEVLDQNLCAKYYIVSESVYQRCIPTLEAIKAADAVLKENNIALDQITNATKVVDLLINAENIIKVVSDELFKVRYYILGGVVAAALTTIVYIILLRYVSYTIVWLSIFATFILLGFCIYYSYIQFKTLPDTPSSNEENFDLILKIRDTAFISNLFRDIFGSKRTWMYLLILSSVLFVILLFLVMFLRSRIKVAIALIGEASRCVTSITSSLAFPIFPWSLQFIVIVSSLTIALYIWSLDDSTYRVVGLYNDKSCICSDQYYSKDGEWCIPRKWNERCHSGITNETCKIASCKFFAKNTNNFATYLFLFNVFAYFWTSSFVSDLSDMILAATFATWYWTFNKRDVPFFTLTSAIFRTLFYHLGTVAFGSLIISICKFIRFLLEYVQKKCKKFDNSFTRAILCALRCFFWCLQKFIAFVNKNAYIMCAIHGANFCKSARGAFSLLIRNAVRVVVVDKVADLLLFLGKVLLTCGISAFAYYHVFSVPVYDFDTKKLFVMKYPWAPVAILGIFTYLISSTFFQVYSMAIDTLFLCFLEDSERNNGTLEKPYFMSKNLMKILKKKNNV